MLHFGQRSVILFLAFVYCLRATSIQFISLRLFFALYATLCRRLLGFVFKLEDYVLNLMHEVALELALDFFDGFCLLVSHPDGRVTLLGGLDNVLENVI